MNKDNYWRKRSERLVSELEFFVRKIIEDRLNTTDDSFILLNAARQNLVTEIMRSIFNESD